MIAKKWLIVSKVELSAASKHVRPMIKMAAGSFLRGGVEVFEKLITSL